MSAFLSDPVALLGIALLITFLSGQAAQRLGAPLVVGYILGGLLMGPSFLDIYPSEMDAQLVFISQLALGVIGVNLGKGLRLNDLVQVGWRLPVVFLIEVALVLLFVGGSAFLISGELSIALIFGALAVATAPGATVEVLREYRSHGPLTTLTMALTALDGVTSIVLFSAALAVATTVMGGGAFAVVTAIGPSLVLIALSTAIGFAMGMLILLLGRAFPKHNQLIALFIAAIFIITGLSRISPVQVVLCTLVMGATVVNIRPDYDHHITHTAINLGFLAFPLFFGLAGARLSLSVLPSLGLLGLSYVLGRNLAKFAGGWFGGSLVGFEPKIRANLGVALFSQAGVVIGLALESQTVLAEYGAAGEELGSLILNAITAVVLILLITGPIFVKLAVSRAGEINMIPSEPEPASP